jgi:glycosyltransferase involved in cell wall biosynthesis
MLALVWRRHREYDVAIVDVYSGRAFIWAEAVARSLTVLRKPYVLSLHGGNLPEFASRRTRRVGRLFSGAAAVVAQSPYLAGILSSYQELVRLIPNPLDLGLYRFRMRSDPQPNLVWLRSFHEVYNPSLAVEVVARVRRHFPNIALTMIGPDKGDGSLGSAQALAEKTGVRRNVAFQGAVPKQDVPRWLDGADIFLNTSSVDNTPVSVQEAMACGLCVVSTNVGGVSYLAQNEAQALLVPPSDPDAMAAAVLRVLMEPGLSVRLSQAARHRVESMDWSSAIESWERLLISVSAGEIQATRASIEGVAPK